MTTKHTETDLFIRQNIFEILQEQTKTGFIKIKNINTIFSNQNNAEEKLFYNFLLWKFHLTNDIHKRLEKFGKSNLKKLIKSTNTEIFNWLDKNNCRQSQRFTLTDQNLYQTSNEAPTLSPVQCFCTNHNCDITKCKNAKRHIECNDTKCPNKKSCNNRESSTNFDFKSLMKIDFIDKQKHFGVIATSPIKKGTYLGLVTGVVISQEQLKETEYSNCDDYIFGFCSPSPFRYPSLKYTNARDLTYFFYLFTNRGIDSRNYGNHTRFFNHSCNPNVSYQLWSTIKGRYHKIRALRDISINEEITIDYNWNTKSIPCHCQSKKCRKFL